MKFTEKVPLFLFVTTFLIFMLTTMFLSVGSSCSTTFQEKSVNYSSSPLQIKMVFDLPFHDYSDIQPIQYPFLQQDGEVTGEDLGGSHKKLNFAFIENENSDTNNSYYKSSEVIENESSLEKMLTTLTGKTKCQRSTKDKAVKFPLKVSFTQTKFDLNLCLGLVRPSVQARFNFN